MEHLPHLQRYVAYYRVSTIRQGASGLGLSARRTSVNACLASRGTIVAEFTDIEAKLDRLTRNAAFIFTLWDSGVEFVCADMPEANTLTIGVMATMAQHEREVIGDRTRKALAEKKKAGFVLGKPENLTPAAVAKGRQQNARDHENNRRAGALVRSLRQTGHRWTHIAGILNENGFRTRRGKPFQAVQVQRILSLYS